MTPQELRESILWRAIQGGITSQYDNETIDASVEAYTNLDGVEYEKYFDIPDNWAWCRIGDIFTLVNGKAFKPSDWATEGTPIVRIQNLNDPKAPYNYCNTEVESKYYLKGGELLFSWSGTPGTSFGAFVWNGGRAVLNQHIFIVYPNINVDTKYLMYALNGEVQVFIDKAHGGAGLKHITKKDFDDCSLPIPPLAEQHRIVAKIESLLPLIDRYEKAWSRLEEFNKRFPGDMQKSLLQLAIQGKLVEHRPEEGTGEELYQKIQQEKARQVKEGTIKKEKPLPEIADDEAPFDVPETWKWVRLGEILTSTDAGKSPQCEDRPRSGDEWGVIKTTAVQNGFFLPDENKVLPAKFVVQDNQIVHSGDLLITRAGPRNRTGVLCVVSDEPTNLILSDKTVRLSYLRGFIDPLFIMYMLNSPAGQVNIVEAMTGMAASQVNISQDSMKKFLLPLPPLAEQRRIVARLVELLPLCERLK